MIFGKSDPKEPIDLKSNGNSAPANPPPITHAAAAPHAPAAAAPHAPVPAMPPAPAAAPAAASNVAQATIRYVDRPDATEQFADSITSLFFDGQMLRIEFAVTRLDEIKPNTPITGRRYPACRLILPATAAVDLINRMQQVGSALTQAGIVKQTPTAAKA
jgi:hypothetical protein